MNKPQPQQANSEEFAFFSIGEMSERTRAFDWSQSPLGPIAQWPQALKIAVQVMLSSRYAMWLGWGPQFTFFYNDAYARMTLGAKHPWALGRPASEVWSEIWHDIGPRAESVVRTGLATWDEGLLLLLERKGFLEETYHTFSYSPVPDDQGGVGGMLCVVTEDTERKIDERRLRTLRELAARSIGEATSVEETCQAAALAVADNPRDLPFLLIYLLDPEGQSARLAGAAGLASGLAASPLHIELVDSDRARPDWPLRDVLESGHAQVVKDLDRRFGSLPCGAWSDSPQQAVVLPMTKPGQTRLAGFIVAGISPRLAFDDGYEGFLRLLTSQIASAVTNASAYEEERRRAEALAELDQVKTAFFSNVSHEFRTPLTLMLGPVEDLLAKSHTDLTPAAADQLAIVNRNGLRLLRLVNSLLDFSRIEAGRVRAVYQATDLGTFTTELASVFRSACERAGIGLAVDCPPLDQPAFVDRDMWEKVVLNLMSNAFKFTFAGKIDVRLRQVDNTAELKVIDTGTGIPATEMPRLFERFHRVQNAHGRTHEGSGIGLALVQELVKLHGGSISAASQLGQGTTFTVSVPLGAAHLPADQISKARSPASTMSGAMPYVEEALRWLPDERPGQSDHRAELPTYEENLPVPHLAGADDANDDRPLILVADDNADMRQYVVRLLAEQFRVESVPDGEAALAATRGRLPDLVLTDVMMPRLDGFGLLRKLRDDPRTSKLPIIMLSARAGEESRVEGMEAGADDYLVKPFSARELLARVTAHLQMAQMRHESEDRLREGQERLDFALAAAELGQWDLDLATLVANRTPRHDQIFGYGQPLEQWTYHNFLDHVIAADRPGVERAFQDAVARGKPWNVECRIRRADGVERWIWTQARVRRDAAGHSNQMLGILADITDRRQAEESLRASERQWRDLAEALPNLVWTDTPDGQCDYLSTQWETYTGIPQSELLGLGWLERVVHPDDRERTLACWLKAVDGKGVYDIEYRIRRHDGEYHWFKTRGVPIRDDQGNIIKWFGTCTDIEDQKQAQQALAQKEERFRQLADAMPQIVWTARADGRIDYQNRQWQNLTGLPASASNEGWDHIVHPDDALPANERWAHCVRTGTPFEMEIRLFDRRTQNYRWHLIRTVPVHDAAGAVARWFGTGTDIHEQKRAEERSRYLAEASVTLANVVDYESTLQKVANLAVPYFADWAAVDVANDDGTLRRLAVAHQDPVQLRLVQQITDEYPPDPQAPGSPTSVLRSGQPLIIAEVSDDLLAQSAKDEHHLSLMRALGLKSYMTVPLVASGSPLGVLTFATAESGRRYNEADLALANDLAQRAAVALENTQLYRALRENDRRKNEFLAVLAHELRNPLAPITNALELMRIGGDGPPEDSAPLLAIMERQILQMTHLVDDLLDVSRISSGKIVLRKRRIDLAEVASSALESSRPLVATARHELTVTLPPGPVYVDGDETRLAQVLSNLLANAAKYTPERGQIWLSISSESQSAVIRIRDTGVGIPAEMLPRIFEMFTQVDRNLGRAQGGLGIGLALVRSLVELHGGTIEARSAGPGQGERIRGSIAVGGERARSPGVRLSTSL